MVHESDELVETLARVNIHENGSPFHDALPCPQHEVDPENTYGSQQSCPGHPPLTEKANSAEVLFNHLIFNRILKSCNVDTLKSLRLVCRTLYQASLEPWRKASVLRLHDWDVESHNAPPGHISPSIFLQLMSHPPSGNILYMAQYPPQNIRLSGWNILQPDADRTEEELWFWRKMNPSLKYLHLDHCTFSERRFYELISGLHYLQHLKMNEFGRLEESNGIIHPPFNRAVKTIEFVGSLPFSKWNFLQTFPKLEAIHLHDFSRNYLFEDLWKLRQYSGFTTHALKTLDVIDTSQRMHGLVEANFPLEHLTLRLNVEVEKGGFTQILEKYGGNLQTLKLFRFPIAWPAYAPFKGFPSGVEFRNLKVLELWGNVISSFNFLKSTPLLEVLKIDLQCFERMRMIEYWRSRKDRMVMFHVERVWDEEKGPFGVEDEVKLDKMHTLEVDYKFAKKSVEVLGKWMPNLRRLATVLDNDTLQVVCGQWPNLKELRLGFGSDVDDNGIVGNCGNRTMPCVRNLRELETFELAVLCGQSKLTEMAIQQGFMRMGALVNLKICVSPQVSLECEEELLDVVENSTLIRNYGDGPHFNDIHCCRRSAFLQRNAGMADN